MVVWTSNKVKILHSTWDNHNYQAWLLRQTRTHGLDASRVAELRKKASLYIERKLYHQSSSQIWSCYILTVNATVAGQSLFGRRM